MTVALETPLCILTIAIDTNSGGHALIYIITRVVHCVVHEATRAGAVEAVVKTVSFLTNLVSRKVPSIKTF